MLTMHSEEIIIISDELEVAEKYKDDEGKRSSPPQSPAETRAAKPLSSAFRATKSVSQLTSVTAAILSLAAMPKTPSLVARAAVLSSLVQPCLSASASNHLTASLMSLLECSRAWNFFCGKSFGIISAVQHTFERHKVTGGTSCKYHTAGEFQHCSIF